MIKIDIDTRCWQIPKEECFLGVESDDKVRILQFELSKNEFCNGLNFTDCNCFINYKNEGNDTISYGITDMVVQEDGTVTFTWKVSRGATIFKGNTFAILCAKKVHDDGTIMNEWNSRIGSFTVAKGLEPLSSIVEVPEIDIISQLLSVAKQTNENAQTNINQSSSLLEKAEGLGYLKEDFDVLEARMNQFTSLKEGSTTGDAELIDGRIGYDGTVYDNIGSSIRGQISELKGDLVELDSQLSKSITEISTYVEADGKKVETALTPSNTWTGKIFDYDNHDKCGFGTNANCTAKAFVVESGKKYRFESVNVNKLRLAYFVTELPTETNRVSPVFAVPNSGSAWTGVETTMISPCNGYLLINTFGGSYAYKEETLSYTQEFLENFANIENDIIDVKAEVYPYIEKVIPVTDTGYRRRTSPFNRENAGNIRNILYECREDDTFMVKGQGGGVIDVWAFFDENGNPLTYSGYNQSIKNYVNIVAPQNTKYLVVNHVITDGVEVGLIYYKRKTVGNPYDAIVDINGKGDFTDIQDAIDWLKSKYDVNNVPVSVFIRNGVYNVVPVTDATHNKPTAIRKGANKISIIGESRDGVIINCMQTKIVQGMAMETGGECSIENLTINVLKASDLTLADMQDINVVKPYCLHADIPMSADKEYKTVVKNCKFYDEVYAPVGAGLNDKQIQRYENVECVYNSTLYNNNGALFVHAPTYNAQAKGLEVVDCVAIALNGGYAMSFPSVSGYQSFSEIPQTFIRNVTASTGANEISAFAPNKTLLCKGNSNSALNA